ncbi:MAG: hypothetical protein ACRDOV_03310 [Streptomyces sp.]
MVHSFTRKLAMKAPGAKVTREWTEYARKRRAMPADVLPFFRYGRDQLDAVRPVLVDVYREVYADEIKADPFFSAEKFEERLTSQAGLPRWEADLAVAYGRQPGTGR